MEHRQRGRSEKGRKSEWVTRLLLDGKAMKGEELTKGRVKKERKSEWVTRLMLEWKNREDWSTGKGKGVKKGGKNGKVMGVLLERSKERSTGKGKGVKEWEGT